MRCHICGSSVPEIPSDVSWVRCPVCEAMVFAKRGGGDVLIAHESEAISQQMGIAVLSVGLTPLRAAQGHEASLIIDTFQPVAGVLDVGLMPVTAFQLIERIRAADPLASMKLVLVASVFSRTSYKRKPSSLYGADDYVEQHHIPDMLPSKLTRLLSLQDPPRPDDVRERVQRIRDVIAQKNLEGDERIRALAHSIVADIALYSEELVSSAVKGNASDALGGHLEEGRQMLTEIVGSVSGWDPIDEAFNALVSSLRGSP